MEGVMGNEAVEGLARALLATTYRDVYDPVSEGEGGANARRHGAAILAAIRADPAAARAVRDAIDPDGLPLRQRVLEALGGFIWIGNNLHNIKADPDNFREFYEAALTDARPVYDALAAIDPLRGLLEGTPDAD